MHPSQCISLDQKVTVEAELSIVPTYTPLVYTAELSEHFIEFLLVKLSSKVYFRTTPDYASTMKASLSVGPN